ncbi:uncharacterized protein K02A2.6-like [Wyeomyia smithii]|uniref:uncharacterized protein K02A2.6-like n=1 Tax=Wyeomyia smithii TaxID=174621 RepID=UPI002467FC09|nr:uncharacterized protein K02A2.6-like [Wyeomyia smithii]
MNTGRWSDTVRKFTPFKDELYCCQGVILRGERLIVPSNHQKRVLRLAHIGHPGIERSKQRLRSKVWWPSMDRDVDKAVRSCLDCQIVGKASPPEPMAIRELPQKPWDVLHLDMLGPLPSGESLLVIIDPYSRYRVIEILRQTITLDIIARLRPLFMKLGIPNMMITDNARNFSSKEMEEFCGEFGVTLGHTTPYWPQANGEIKRQNRSILKVLRIAELNGSDWKKDLDEYNYVYALTRHPGTGFSPAEILFGRKFRDWIPQFAQSNQGLDSELRDNDKIYKFNSKVHYDAAKGTKESHLSIGDKVLMKNLKPANKLAAAFHSEPARVLQKKGNSVLVETPTGQRYQRNSSHLKKLQSPECDETIQDEEEEDEETLEWSTPLAQDRETPASQTRVQRAEDADKLTTETKEPTTVKTRRQVKKPLRFEDYVFNVNQDTE